MKKPRFKEHDQVFYRGRKAKVVLLVNEGDAADIRAQGHRYYVSQARNIWSVPEASLSLTKQK